MSFFAAIMPGIAPPANWGVANGHNLDGTPRFVRGPMLRSEAEALVAQWKAEATLEAELDEAAEIVQRDRAAELERRKRLARQQEEQERARRRAYSL